jgi:hypothetical protein
MNEYIGHKKLTHHPCPLSFCTTVQEITHTTQMEGWSTVTTRTRPVFGKGAQSQTQAPSESKPPSTGVKTREEYRKAAAEKAAAAANPLDFTSKSAYPSLAPAAAKAPVAAKAPAPNFREKVAALAAREESERMSLELFKHHAESDKHSRMLIDMVIKASTPKFIRSGCYDDGPIEYEYEEEDYDQGDLEGDVDNSSEEDKYKPLDTDEDDEEDTADAAGNERRRGDNGVW